MPHRWTGTPKLSWQSSMNQTDHVTDLLMIARTVARDK